MIADAGQLIVRRDGDVVETVPLNLSVLTIGRAPENGLTLPDPLVSRHHAEIRNQPSGPMLTDLASANGTYLGETRLLAHQPRLLEDGASFSIGPYAITYQAVFSPLAEEDVSLPVAEAPLAPPEPPKAPSPVLEPVQVGVSALPVLTRTTVPAPPASGPASAYLHNLPALFQDNDFLARFLLIFESVWEPLEQRQDHIAEYFDARTCPASFLPWLAGWLGLAFNVHWPEARRRRLLAEAMDLYRWRGTAYGLARIIEICTGQTPQITDSPSDPFVFVVRIAPPSGGSIDNDLLDDLILAHKPAHTGYRLEMTSWLT